MVISICANGSTSEIDSYFAFGEDMRCMRRGRYHESVKFVVDYFYAATLIHQCHQI